MLDESSEAYGRSYPNPDLYVPDRIDLLNREGRLHSIICESPEGDVVGHYALERPNLGPIGEAGQAVIDHRHRGHGLMKPMRAAVEEAGRSDWVAWNLESTDSQAPDQSANES